jgi:mRNA-degrading endonuclease RelE of RelBE toxin-antitoxin system
MTFARRLTPAVLFDPRALAEHQRVQEEFRKALSEPLVEPATHPAHAARKPPRRRGENRGAYRARVFTNGGA